MRFKRKETMDGEIDEHRSQGEGREKVIPGATDCVTWFVRA